MSETRMRRILIDIILSEVCDMLIEQSWSSCICDHEHVYFMWRMRRMRIGNVYVCVTLYAFRDAKSTLIEEIARTRWRTNRGSSWAVGL